MSGHHGHAIMVQDGQHELTNGCREGAGRHCLDTEYCYATSADSAKANVSAEVAQGCGSFVEHRADIPGHDISQHRDLNLQECKAACCERPVCHGFTWPGCQLKGSVSLSQSDKWTAYVLVSPRPALVTAPNPAQNLELGATQASPLPAAFGSGAAQAIGSRHGESGQGEERNFCFT